ECEVVALTEDALDGIDVALFLVPGEVSARWAPGTGARRPVRWCYLPATASARIGVSFSTTHGELRASG
ncbi:hypothetical protein ABZ457_30225, partial [Streptomyces sp. NPDC005805]